MFNKKLKREIDDLQSRLSVTERVVGREHYEFGTFMSHPTPDSLLDRVYKLEARIGRPTPKPTPKPTPEPTLTEQIEALKRGRGSK